MQSLQQQVSDLQATLGGLEESMTQADSTITRLKTELQASVARETQLQQAVETEHRQASELKETVSGKQSVARQLEKTQTRLCDAEARLAEMESLNQNLQQNLDEAHKQLVLANRDAAKSNSLLQQNMREVERLQSQLHQLPSSNQVEKPSQDEEVQSVAALKLKLCNKEIERAKAVEQYLQERLTLAKARDEIEALQAKLEQEHHTHYNGSMARINDLEKSMSQLLSSINDATEVGPSLREEFHAKVKYPRVLHCVTSLFSN